MLFVDCTIKMMHFTQANWMELSENADEGETGGNAPLMAVWLQDLGLSERYSTSMVDDKRHSPSFKNAGNAERFLN